MSGATSSLRAVAVSLVTVAVAFAFEACACSRPRARGGVSVQSLLEEMVDLEELARDPEPFFKEATATSYDRASLREDEWFANADFDQFVRVETHDGRTEHVLADLVGPGTTTRLWTASPSLEDRLRFYFDGEGEPRLSCTMAELFEGRCASLTPPFAYVVGGAGNLYFPFPYARSLKITHTADEAGPKENLYYQIGYRTYVDGTRVETYEPRNAPSWRSVQADVARAVDHPRSGAPFWSERLAERLTVAPGETRSLRLEGEKTVYEWSARVLGTDEGAGWDAPSRAHNAYRFLLLEVDFDGEKSVRVPLGDFFGSGPGVNPFQNLLFTVEGDGTMTSRLRMPFYQSMTLSLTNAGKIPYAVDLKLRAGKHAFTRRDWHLRAEWGAVTHDTWPPFDMALLAKTGRGKVVGSVYEIANPVLVWWGEGDQKIFVDGEAFPSTFGTGTEDDYGWAYARGDLFGRPFHAQTRVDGPRNGGLVSMNRFYVLDALPYRKQIRFDQEVVHWIPCRPTFAHVVYWYAKPGDPGPLDIDRTTLPPVNLGRPADMLSFEGEKLAHEETGGRAAVEHLANCSDAEHLVWRRAKPGDKLTVHFQMPQAGRYLVKASLSQSGAHGREKVSVNGRPAEGIFDGCSTDLHWQLPTLGVFDLREGDNTLGVEALEPNPNARPENLFGLDYIVVTRQSE